MYIYLKFEIDICVKIDQGVFVYCEEMQKKNCFPCPQWVSVTDTPNA